METQSHKLTVGILELQDVFWFVETAVVNMITYELKRPELLNFDNLYLLAYRAMDSQTAFIVKKGEQPVGALASLLVPNIYNPKITTLVELFWYVLPEYRNTRAGALLFNAFEKKGEECADEATLSLLGSSSLNIKTLEKRGFLLGEFSFLKQYKER